LLHSLASTGPATGPFRRITTIHDLIYRKLPREHAGIRFFGARYLVSRGLIPLAARRSNRIIVTSKIVAEDLQAHLRISPDKIDVCPLGPGRPGRRTPTEERELRERYALADRRIALCLSPVWPHKNVVRLPEAMSLIPPPCRPLLIISGRATRYSPALIEAARRYGVESDLRITDWVTPEDLDGLYALADCVVVPSLYEGFGFPVLEAMSRGVPVACSSGGALPEVGGDAALYFDPRSSAEIAEAMLRILSNPRDAERLRAAGQRRAADFSWQRAAQATLRSYERTLGHRLTEDAV
jgi:glycosyltransferase involved in cell wall biosynthesis